MEFENSVLGSAVVISESDAYTTTVFSEGLVVGAADEVVGVADDVEVADGDTVGEAEVMGVEIVVEDGVGFCVM